MNDALQENDVHVERRKYDEAHSLIFHHVDDATPQEKGSFAPFQPIPRPVSLPRAATHCDALEHEVRRNGFDDVLVTPQGDTLLSIARAKLKHPIHVQLGRPLGLAHVLALLLYTGTDVQWYFSNCHRQGDFNKWKSLHCLLESAIKKLHAVKSLKFVWRYTTDTGKCFAGGRVSDRLLQTWNLTNPTLYEGGKFTYVTGTDMVKCAYEDAANPRAVVEIGDQSYIAERVSVEEFRRGSPYATGTNLQFPEYELPKILWRGVHKTGAQTSTSLPDVVQYYDFVSTSTSRRVAEKNFLGRGEEQGILFKLERDSTAIYADVSWISKFQDEEEILFAPSIWRKLEGGVVHAIGQDRDCLMAHYKLGFLSVE